ncbi:cytochrome P450 [Amycolatopsis samaneae]|uniref:Cytochrome P450 n=1 Tax=Amycolatopsis samaneae TaxID=664691 RepID=A0ABW5GRR1_9PSEU
MTETVTTAGDAPPKFPEPRTCPYDPPPGYVRMSERGPLHRVTLYDGSIGWLVARHAEARRLLADPRLSSDRTRPDFPVTTPRMGRMRTQAPAFIGLDPPRHGTLRRTVLSGFTVRRVRALRPDIERIYREFADRLAVRKPPVDLLPAYAQTAPTQVICLVLGVPYADREFFEEAGVRLALATDTEQSKQAGADLSRYLDGYLRTLEGRRSAWAGPGLLGKVAGQVTAGVLTHEDAVRTAMLVLLGGHEALASMIVLGTLTLLNHPAQLAALRADPAGYPAAVEELLRYLSIGDTIVRVAKSDVDIDGVVIRAGEGVVVPHAVVNRDGEAFPGPDALDVRRPARHHLAFGFGVHQCVGQNLARMEIEIALSTLFTRLPGIRLAVPAEELSLRHPWQVQGVNELPITW